MRANEYKLMERCIEDGAKLGLARAHKHTDTPTIEQVANCICDAVMLEISEWFAFDEVHSENTRGGSA